MPRKTTAQALLLLSMLGGLDLPPRRKLGRCRECGEEVELWPSGRVDVHYHEGELCKGRGRKPVEGSVSDAG